tara:strand:- start:479 stop:610 length:132 start_codon:yes stop_codon:yes gene_type:complete
MRKKSAKKLRRLARALTAGNKFENIEKVYQRLKKVHKSNKGEV